MKDSFGRQTLRRVWILLATACVGACGNEGSQAPAVPELAATPSTTFGDPEGDGVLSNVWGVAVSDEGQVFLSEPQFARVVAFNADGSFARVVGERGDGPGEFRTPGALLWRGDSLAVTDFQRGISLFAPDGTFAGLIAYHISDASSPFGVRPMLALDDGSVAALAPVVSGAAVDGTTTRQAWLRTSRDGVILDTLVFVGLNGGSYDFTFRDVRMSMTLPLSWAPLLTAPPRATSMVVVERSPWTGEGDPTYGLVRVAPNGDTLAAGSVPYDPIAVPPEQVDSLALVHAERLAERLDATPAAVAAAIKEQAAWPPYHPPVTTVLAGDDGSVWVRREAVGGTSARWDVLDERFSLVGWVALPVGLDLKVVSMDRVYGIEHDDFDVPRVVRYDITGER